MEENKMWSVLWVCCAVGLLIACGTAKGCNDSDNELQKAAIEKGCSVMRIGEHQQILCGDKKGLLQ